MLPASNTTVRLDQDLPGQTDAPGSIGPDFPQQRRRPESAPRRRFPRLAASVVVLTAAALVLVGVANLQVARGRDAVERDLATARLAAAQVGEHLGGGDGNALVADLDLLSEATDRARAGSTGPSWVVAGWADLNGTRVRGLRSEVEQFATLAVAGRELRDALAPLRTGANGTGGATMTGPEGPRGLYALDDLARGLSRYATATDRAGDPSAGPVGRAALAAGMLPALAGGDGPRTWTVCQEATGPCTRVRVADTRSGTPRPGPAPESATPPGRRWAAGVDVLVIGIEPAALFPRAGTFDSAAVLALLLRLGRDPVTVRSAVGPEQQAIDRLSQRW